MLLDVVDHIIASTPDMVVAGRIAGDGDLLAEARRAHANVVLVEHRADGKSEPYDALLRRRPRLKVLALAPDGRTGCLYEMRPKCIPLGAMSTAALRDAIRGRTPSNAATEPR